MSDENQDAPFESDSAVELAEIRQQIRDDILAKVLGTWEGRFVLFEIIGRGDVYDQDGEMPFDNAKVQRALGRRAVSLEVLKDALRIDPNSYILMQQEAGAFEAQFKLVEPGSDEDENDD